MNLDLRNTTLWYMRDRFRAEDVNAAMYKSQKHAEEGGGFYNCH